MLKFTQISRTPHRLNNNKFMELSLLLLIIIIRLNNNKFIIIKSMELPHLSFLSFLFLHVSIDSVSKFPSDLCIQAKTDLFVSKFTNFSCHMIQTESF